MARLREDSVVRQFADGGMFTFKRKPGEREKR